jgi:hypothetical protein
MGRSVVHGQEEKQFFVVGEAKGMTKYGAKSQAQKESCSLWLSKFSVKIMTVRVCERHFPSTYNRIF